MFSRTPTSVPRSKEAATQRVQTLDKAAHVTVEENHVQLSGGTF